MIGMLITDACQKYINHEYEQALFQVCAPIDATAKAEGKPGTRRGYKEFLSDNITLITGAMSIPSAGFRWEHAHNFKGAESNTNLRLEEAIYHLVRCGLYHDAKLPENFQLTEETVGGSNGILKVPKSVVIGLIASVIGSPTNANERLGIDFMVKDHGTGEEIHFKDCWGKKELMQETYRRWYTTRRNEWPAAST
jgi:hypothetical protein